MISHGDISSDNNITVIFRVSFRWKLSCVFRFTNNTVLCDLQHKKGSKLILFVDQNLVIQSSFS